MQDSNQSWVGGTKTKFKHAQHSIGIKREAYYNKDYLMYLASLGSVTSQVLECVLMMLVEIANNEKSTQASKVLSIIAETCCKLYEAHSVLYVECVSERETLEKTLANLKANSTSRPKKLVKKANFQELEKYHKYAAEKWILLKKFLSSSLA